MPTPPPAAEPAPAAAPPTPVVRRSGYPVGSARYGHDGRVMPTDSVPARPESSRTLPGWGEVFRYQAGPCPEGVQRTWYATPGGEWLVPPFCEVCGYREEVARVAATLVPVRDTRAAIEAEATKLRQEYPGLVAAGLLPDLPAAPAAGLFDVGRPVREPRREGNPPVELVDDATWRALLSRHAAGDFGRVGRVDDVMLTDDDRWGARLVTDPLRRNVVSIDSGFGVVRSLYGFPPGITPPAVRPGQSGTFALSITTALVPGREPLTVCRVARLAAQP